MRFVKRSAVAAPESLTAIRGKGAKELERQRKYFSEVVASAAGPPVLAAAPEAEEEKKKKQPSFRAYKGDDVRHALELLFHGKCAYCETRYDVTAPVDVEHFRPKGAVLDEAHPGYWWLAAEWRNLLPSCIDCNRRREQKTPSDIASLYALLEEKREADCLKMDSGKGACFPISGTRVMSEPAASLLRQAHDAEGPLLLDPCSEDPRKHLRFLIDRTNHLGVIFPASNGAVGQVAELPLHSADPEQVAEAAAAAGASVKGAVSIQIYGLNRLKLVQERTRILRRLEFLAETFRDFMMIADDLDAAELMGRDIAVVSQAVAQMRKAGVRTLMEIREMMLPSAPFSELASAWFETFKTDMAAERIDTAVPANDVEDGDDAPEIAVQG